MVEMTGAGLPAALVIRLATVAAIFALARRAGVCRQIAMGGSMLASAVTTMTATQVIAAYVLVLAVIFLMWLGGTT